jgi:Mrp family chromosome partitioning ATPase
MSAPDWWPARRLLAARAAWILLTTLAVLAGTWLFQASAPVVYSSTASIVLESAVAPGTTPLAPAMGTEKEVAVSGAVLDLAAATLGTTERELAGRVSASVPPDANILDLQCTASTPEDARRCAQTVADDYVAYRDPARTVSSGAHSSSPIRASVVTQASLPTAPKRTSPTILLGVGLVAGLSLGVATAYLRDRTDDRLRSVDDLKENAGIPVLPLIPRRARTDDFRALRVQLEGMVGRFHRLVVVVTAVGPKDDETMMATGLAVALARSGAQVTLVDAHVRAPRLHARFGLSDFVGLTDLLAGGVSAQQAVQATSVPRLHLIAAGVKDEDSPQLLVPERLWPVLEQLRSTADVVVVDCPPVLAAPDAAAAGMGANAVLLLAELGRTRRAAVRRAAAELSHPINVLLAAVPIERHSRRVTAVPPAWLGPPGTGEQPRPPAGRQDLDAADGDDAQEAAEVDGDVEYPVSTGADRDDATHEDDHEESRNGADQNGGEQDSNEQNGGEQNDTQQDSNEQNSNEQNSNEQNGGEQNDTQQDSNEQNSNEQNGTQQDNSEQNGAQQNGTEQNGAQQNGAVQNGNERVLEEFRKTEGANASANGVARSDVRGVR